MIKKIEIKIGQSWIVDSNHFMAFPNLNKRKSELLDKGTKFKILHVEEWHFLTDKGKVYFAKPHEILEHCKCLEEPTSIKDIIQTTKKQIDVKCSYMRKKIKNEDI